MTSLKLNQNWRGLSSLFGSETFTYVVKRLLQALLTLFLASALCFAIIELAPGNYLDTLSQNPKISPETLKQLEQQFGLDKPAIVQYWLWLQQIVTRGNFGTSFVYQRSVASLLWGRGEFWQGVGAPPIRSFAAVGTGTGDVIDGDRLFVCDLGDRDSLGNCRGRQSKPHSRSSSTSSQLHRTGISQLYRSVAAAIFCSQYFASFSRRRNDEYRPQT